MRISDWSSDVCSSDLRRTEVTDVGHAAADEDFIDNCAGNVRQCFHVVGIVRASNDRLMYVGQIDFDDGSVFGVGDRTSVVEGKRLSGRVDLGGLGICKKIKKIKTNDKKKIKTR